MIMSSRDLLCVVLEILGLIFIVTVCIVLAAPIELHPVGALHVADSCQKLEHTGFPCGTWFNVSKLWARARLVEQRPKVLWLLSTSREARNK